MKESGRGLDGREAKGGDDSPPTEEVYQNRSVLDRRVDTKQEAEDIEDVVSVVSQGEWVHDRVEMDDGEHDWHDNQTSHNTR